MKPAFVVLLFIAIMVGQAPNAMAKPIDRYGLFLYSNLCWDEQSGDGAGYRVTLSRLGDGDALVFDDPDEGGLDRLTGYQTKITKDGAIRFQITLPGVHENSQVTSTFVGTITDEAIIGTMEMNGAYGDAHKTRKMALPRVRNFAATTQTCR